MTPPKCLSTVLAGALRLVLATSLALSLATSFAASLGAQTVRGAVARAGVPMPGVVVQLLDSNEVVAATGITDGSGVYRLIAVRAGRYRVLARRVGFTPHRTALFSLLVGETREEDIPLSGIAVGLDTIRVRAKSCTLLARADAEVAAVWEQTKTALLATDATATARPLSTMLMRYEQTDRGAGPLVRDVGVLEVDSASMNPV